MKSRILVRTLGITLMVCLTASLFLLNKPQDAKKPFVKLSKEARIDQAFKRQFELTKDLSLGYPPTQRLQQAYELIKRKQIELQNRSGESIAGSSWSERGPYDVAGRTRTIMFDSRDPSYRTVWTGGVGGGVWKTNDIAASPAQWTPMTDFMPNIAITDIVQSKINPEIMFYCTGEGYSNGDAIRGLGVFRSTDGGETWALLSSTQTWEYSYRMLAHPKGDLYVNTDQGVYRSSDNGLNFTKVIGGGLSGTFSNVFYDIELSSDGKIYVSTASAIYRSSTGDVGDWTNITNGTGFPSGVSRTEFTVSPSDPNTIYAATANGAGDGEGIYRTTNGGATWTSGSLPNAIGMDNYCRGQAWYDLDIAVDPNNPLRIVVGGIDPHMSTNGGSTWTQLAQWAGAGLQYVHADQHRIMYQPGNSNVLYITNDGGVWRSSNASASPAQVSFRHRNETYNVTQFYAAAIHPDAFSNYFLAGAQDNGSQQFYEPGVSRTREVMGGDGAFCHIDQSNPNIQFVSIYFGSYSMTRDGGVNWGSGPNSEGSFISPSDYDDDANILYSQTNNQDQFHRSIILGNMVEEAFVTVTGPNGLPFVNCVKVDPNTPNRVYFGSFGGSIIRVDNANTGTSVAGTPLTIIPSGGTVSSIAIEDGDPNHLLVTLSNYGLANSIWESKNGGVTWIPSEGVNIPNNLPDMPVNYALFNPNNPTQAIIATEAGIWSTDSLQGNNTRWDAPNLASGVPITRVEMLQIRESDNVVLACTHGRGLFTSDVFSVPTPFAMYDRVHYTNSPMNFDGSLSLRASSYLWSFGDGATANTSVAQHSYSNIGTYNVDLTINGNVSAADDLKILPDRSVPYKPGITGYGGDFENFTEDFGVYTVKGSSLERGRSTLPYKDGTNSGNNAFVLGLTESFYQRFTHTMLYTPNFDLSAPGIYELSFFAKYQLDPGDDGFNVEYSLDRGQTWQVLGSDSEDDWYNYRSSSQTAFPSGTPYFTNIEVAFTQFKRNISEFAGQPNVAFRFVVKSDGAGNHSGLVIDDFVIDVYNEQLATKLTSFTARFIPGNSIQVDWSTFPEYRLDKFELEVSENGRDFEFVTSVDVPLPGSSITPKSYTYEHVDRRKSIYFYRLKVIGLDTSTNFYSNTIVVKRNLDGFNVYRVWPNPVVDNHVEITFTDGINDVPLTTELYDYAGKLIQSETQTFSGAWLSYDFNGDLPPGIYILRLNFEGQPDPITVRFFKF